MSAFVGEGEAALRAAFSRARLTAPAILFIDEIDAVAGMTHIPDKYERQSALLTICEIRRLTS